MVFKEVQVFKIFHSFNIFLTMGRTQTQPEISILCYKQIKDNFWFAKFDSSKIVMMKDCGFVNVTKLCCDNGKSFNDFLNDEQYKESFEYMITELTGEDGTPPFKIIQQSGPRARTIS